VVASQKRAGVSVRAWGGHIFAPSTAVRPVISGGVARHFAADGRRTFPHLFGNRSQVYATSHSRRNEVSFFSGELVIHHVAIPVWPERGSRSIPAPPLLKQVLRFRCESADDTQAAEWMPSDELLIC
jgi:hypothetical protein